VQWRLKESYPHKWQDTKKPYNQSFYYKKWQRSSKQRFPSNFILAESSSPPPECTSERSVASIELVAGLHAEPLKPAHLSDEVQLLSSRAKHKIGISSYDRHTRSKVSTITGSENGISGMQFGSHNAAKRVRGDDTQGQTLSKLYEYVHKKYGCPRSQLQLIAHAQTFQTRAVDTSGCGDGTIIYSPVESSVSQPTPKHAVEMESETSVLEAVVEPPKGCSLEDECSHEDKCRYGNEFSHDVLFDEWECHDKNVEDIVQSSKSKKLGQLEFESNFESGNLLKASKT